MPGSAQATLAGRIRAQKALKPIFEAQFAGKVYLVGGAIRELILGKPAKDYDFALEKEEDLKRLEKLFRSHSFVLGKKPIQAHRITRGRLTIDVTFLKTSIEEDLLRRDFTMNAIAYDIAGDRLIDTLGGLADVAAGFIRCPDKANIVADPLRMLKAVRHLATLKDFVLDQELMEAIGELKSHIRETARERIKYELDLTLISPGGFGALRLMERTGLLFEIFPELKALRELDQEKSFELGTFSHTIDGFRYLRKFARIYGLSAQEKRHVAYALLFHDLGKATTFSYDEDRKLVHFFYHERVSRGLAEDIMVRMKFSSLEMRTILLLIEIHMRIFLISNEESTEKAARRLVHKAGDLTPLLIVLTLCDMYGSSGGRENPSTRRVRPRCDELRAVFEEWKKEPLPKLINGRDLLALGYPQGVELGRCLAEISEKQAAGDIRGRTEALDYARGRLSLK